MVHGPRLPYQSPKGGNAAAEMGRSVRTGAPKNMETLAAGPAAVRFQGESTKNRIYQMLRQGQPRVVPAALWARGLVQRNRTSVNRIVFFELGTPFRIFPHPDTWHAAMLLDSVS